jgi:hypothetical protein
MPIPIKCACGKALAAPDATAGKKVRCPGCMAVIDVPQLPTLLEAVGAEVVPAAQPESIPEVEEIEPPEVEAVQPDRDKRQQAAPKKGKRKMLFITALIAVPLFGCVVGCFTCIPGFYYFVIDTHWQDTVAFSEHERYLPDDCHSVASLNSNRLYSSALFEDLREPGQTHRVPTYQFNNDLYELSRQTKADDVRIYTTTRPVSAGRTGLSTLGSTPAGKYTVYGSKENADAFLEGNTFLQGNRDTLVSILKRNGKPNLGDKMKKAMSRVDFSRWVATAKVGPFQVGEFSPPYMADLESISTEWDFNSGYYETQILEFKDLESLEKWRPEVEARAKKDTEHYFKGVPLNVSSSGTLLTVKFSLTREESKTHKGGLGMKLINPPL